MAVELNVLFKSMQRDDKKEVLKFEIKGEEMPFAQSLVEMAGGIVVFDVEGCEAGETTAEFATLQRDSKKTVLKFNIKGDSEDKAIKLYRHAGTNVKLRIQAAQISIDEYYGEDEHEGIEYRVNPDGTVDVSDDNQLAIEDVAEASEDAEATSEGGDEAASEEAAEAENTETEKVADLAKARTKRIRKKKDETAEKANDEDTLPTADDDLPF